MYIQKARKTMALFYNTLCLLSQMTQFPEQHKHISRCNTIITAEKCYKGWFTLVTERTEAESEAESESEERSDLV